MTSNCATTEEKLVKLEAAYAKLLAAYLDLKQQLIIRKKGEINAV